MFARASNLVSGQPWLTVRMEQGAFGGILCLLRSGWSLRWFHVCICSDVSAKGFAFAFREGCLELASEVGRVSERTTFKRSARSRALKTVVPAVVAECSSFGEDEVSLSWREGRAEFPGGVSATSGSLSVGIGGPRCFLSRGKHHF